MFIKANCKALITIVTLIPISCLPRAMSDRMMNSVFEDLQEAQHTPNRLQCSTTRSKCNEAEATFWKMLTLVVPLSLTIGVGIWIYYLSHVTKLTVAMSKDTEYLIKDLAELSKKFNELEQRNRIMEVQIAKLKEKLKHLPRMNKKRNVEIRKLHRKKCGRKNCLNV